MRHAAARAAALAAAGTLLLAATAAEAQVQNNRDEPPVTTSVVINEVHQRGGEAMQDFVELANIGSGDVDLTGWRVVDDKGVTDEPVLMNVSSSSAAGLVFGTRTCPVRALRRGGVVALFSADDDEAGEENALLPTAPVAQQTKRTCELPFKLGKGDSVQILDASGRVVDRISYKGNLHKQGHSYGRSPDGYGPYAILAAPTPGRANAAYVVLDAPGVDEPDVLDPEDTAALLAAGERPPMSLAASRPNALATLGVDAASFTSNLPIAYMRVQTHIRDEPKILAELWISRCSAPPLETLPLGLFSSTADGGYVPRRQCSFQDPPDYDGNAGVEFRGSTSQRFQKKGFSVKLADADGFGDEASLLGMPEHEEWVLHGPSHDGSLVRNAFAMWAGREGFGWWAPRTRLVELFVDEPRAPGAPGPAEVYRGVYVLMEKVSRGKHRVDVKKRSGKEGDDFGLILKHDNNNIDPGDRVVYSARTRLPFIITYPSTPKLASSAARGGDAGKANATSPAPLPLVRLAVSGAAPEATSVQLRAIELQVRAQQAAAEDAEDRAVASGALDAFEERLFAGGAGLEDIADMDSFVDYFLHTELLRNPDGYRGSTFVHKEDAEGKLIMGPVWDANEALANPISYNAAQNAAVQPEGWRFLACTQAGACVGDVADGTSQWFQRLWVDPAFRERVARRWAQVRATNLSDDMLRAWFRTYAIELGAGAAAREYERWPPRTRGELGGACTRGADGATRCGPQFRRRRLSQASQADEWRAEFERLEEWVARRVQWLDQAVLA